MLPTLPVRYLASLSLFSRIAFALPYSYFIFYTGAAFPLAPCLPAVALASSSKLTTTFVPKSRAPTANWQLPKLPITNYELLVRSTPLFQTRLFVVDVASRRVDDRSFATSHEPRESYSVPTTQSPTRKIIATSTPRHFIFHQRNATTQRPIEFRAHFIRCARARAH